MEKHEVCLVMLHGFDFGAWVTGTPRVRQALLPAAQERILAQKNGKNRFAVTVRDLSPSFALAMPSAQATRIRGDAGVLQAIQSVRAKHGATEAKPQLEQD